ncbi:hypothetical protein FHT08_002625 [Xanthomonas campestris]|uniref:hypothetical protein n=1 Tax=Xanthomonas sp. CFBP 8151 TaxID=3035310 RepID=UPI00141BA364|nr:hypothetical protein [Xanthomonas sp. CFBP 8151]NIJ77542.1 hypothetical protein [Xanthomonas sp. CFBP 8151]
MRGISVAEQDVNVWLAELKPYQQQTLEVFLATDTIEASAERWLSSTGSPNIAPFGGAADHKPFWSRFKDEFHRFICDDMAYVEERKALSSESSVAKAMMISVISAAIGATIGYSSTLLAPAVALLLCLVGKMGVNAYCSAG